MKFVASKLHQEFVSVYDGLSGTWLPRLFDSDLLILT